MHFRVACTNDTTYETKWGVAKYSNGHAGGNACGVEVKIETIRAEMMMKTLTTKRTIDSEGDFRKVRERKVN